MIFCSVLHVSLATIEKEKLTIIDSFLKQYAYSLWASVIFLMLHDALDISDTDTRLCILRSERATQHGTGTVENG